METYDKRILLAALILIACFIHMFFSKDSSEFPKSIILYIVAFYFGSSDKKGKDDTTK